MDKAPSFNALFLYSNVSASLSLINGLKDKGVDGRVVSSSAELIQSIVKINADVIGISVNHPSSSSLLQVIKNNTHIPVIIFGEDDKSETLRKIQTQQADYKINGVISTYNLWMKINGIIKKKLEEVNAASAANAAAASKAQDKTKGRAIVVKGSGPATKKNGGAIITTGKVKKNKKPPTFAVEIKRDKPPGKPTLIISKGTGQKKKAAPPKIIKKTQDEKNQKVPTLFLEKNKKKEHKPKAPEVAIKPVNAKEASAPGSVRQLSGDAVDALGSVKTNAETTNEQVGSVLQKKSGETKDSKVIDLSGTEELRVLADLDKVGEEKVGPVEPQRPGLKEKNFRQFKEATQSSLGALFKNVSPEKKQDFTVAKKLAVVPVENKDENGYLLLCRKDGEFLSSEQIERFNEKLSSEASSPESQFKIKDFYHVEVTEFDLMTWAGESSQFFFTFEDPEQGVPILLCYFKKNPVYPFLKLTQETGMYRIDLLDIPADTPAAFDAYIYFMRNRRTVLYLRRGSSLAQKQIQRLLKRGFKTVMIKQEDIPAFYKFYISRVIQTDIISSLVSEKSKAA